MNRLEEDKLEMRELRDRLEVVESICRLEEKLEARITEVEEPQKVKERTGEMGEQKEWSRTGG